jgi:hypothetical protein
MNVKRRIIRRDLDGLTRNIEVSSILLIQHRCGDVRNIPAGVAFSGDVDLEVRDAKCLLEIFEEANKILSNCFLCLSSCSADGIACSNWLFDPVMFWSEGVELNYLAKLTIACWSD